MSNDWIAIENLDGTTLDAEQFTVMLSQNKQFQTAMLKYKAALLEIETKFKVLDLEFSLKHDRNPIESIRTRLKSPDSILGKLKKKGIPMEISSMEEAVLDIAGVRVVTAFEEDVYLLANALTSQNDIEVLEVEDYISQPKENGYRSLHITVRIPIFFAAGTRFVPVEIQFRTIAMDFWASLEHKLRYKKGLAKNEQIESQLKECADSSLEWDKKMEAMMHMIFSQNGTPDDRS